MYILNFLLSPGDMGTQIVIGQEKNFLKIKKKKKKKTHITASHTLITARK
jgi:hypothetical protein